MPAQSSKRPPPAIERLFRPKSVAIIGASDQPDSVGTGITRHLLEQTAEVQVHLVNRHRPLIFGRPALGDVSELPPAIDLALIMTPWAGIPAMIESLAARDTGCAVVISLCDPDPLTWRSRRGDLRKILRSVDGSRMRVVGPASQGVILPRLKLNLSLCPATPENGSVAFVSTSGAIASVIVDWAANRGLGMSSVLALGDAADLGYAETLDWLAADSATRAVLLYLEQLPPARRFLSAAKNLAMIKPLVVLAPDAIELGSAVGSQPPSAALLRAALERCGALCVENLDDFCAAANVDLPTWPHAGSRFAIAGNGSGLTRLGSNAVRRIGGDLAELSPTTISALRKALPPGSALANPLDLGRDADGARYARCAGLLAADPQVDAVLVCHHPTSFAASEQIAASLHPGDEDAAPLLAAFAGAAQDRPRHTLARRGIAAFETPEAAVQAYALNREYFRQRALIKRTRPALQRLIRIDHELADHSLATREADLSGLFSAAGVALTPAPAGDRRQRLRWFSEPQLGPYLHAGSDQQRCLVTLPMDRLGARDALIAIGTDDLESAVAARAQTDLIAISELYQQRGEIAELEIIDPRWSPDGLLAAEVHLRMGNSDRAELAFAPYPDVETEVIDLDDRQLLLRPIRAEDEPALQRAFDHLSAEEVRMRFLHPVTVMTHELAARLSQLDYDRETALVLCDPAAPGQAEIYAVVRASYDLTRKEAEFAIIVQRQLNGRGLGSLLMERIIEMASEAGMELLWGQVLSENVAMLALADKLGFKREASEGLIRITLPLPHAPGA